MSSPMASRIGVQARESITAPSSQALLKAAHSLQAFTTASTSPILDIGCGPGETTASLLSVYGPRLSPSTKVITTDLLPEMVSMTTKRRDAVLFSGSTDTDGIPAEQWTRVETRVADAMDLSQFSDGQFSYVLAGFVLFFLLTPQQGLKEIQRVLEPNGVLALTSWKESDWMALMHLCFKKIRPETKLPGPPKEWASVEGVKGELVKAGFRDVGVEELGIEMPLDDYEGLVKFNMSWPAIKDVMKDWTEEEKVRVVEVCVEELREGWPVLPATLKGTAIVGVGRK